MREGRLLTILYDVACLIYILVRYNRYYATFVCMRDIIYACFLGKLAHN